MTRTTRDALTAFAVGVLAVIAFLQIGGGAPEPAPVGIPDPGLLVGWALPMVKLVTDASAVLTIGMLLLAVFLLVTTGPEVEGLSVQAARLASRWAWLWAVASVALYFLTVSDIFAAPLSGLTPNLIWSLFIDAATGQAIVLQTVGAVIVAIAASWTVSVRSLALVLGLAVATTTPITLTGHAASAGSHTLATTSLMLHVVGVTLWVGGLAALGWVALRGSKRLTAGIERFSHLAVWAYVIVGVSGVVNATVRVTSLADLFGTHYGVLILAKTTALVVLGVFGWVQRRRIVAAGGGFVRLATTELLVMAGTIGLGVALSRTPTPLGEEVLTTPAEELLGGPMPAPPSVSHLLLGWSASGTGLAIVGLGTALYVHGVIVLRRRGDAWPVGRTISWLAGMLVVAWSTFGGLGEYAHAMFSAHMGSHMLLSMVAPILLVLAAPVTLALRTLPGPRRPGEVSPRSLLLAFLHSRFSRFVTHPLVGPVLFTGSLYALYFTPLFGALMANHSGHALMNIHFLTVGALYYYVLVGVDPAPRSFQPLVRFGLLLVTIPFHAFYAIAVMSSDTVIAGDYYRELDRPFATDLLADQYLGGGIAWAMGEVPLVLVMAAIFVQWFRSDTREARRYDRSAERDEDAALEAYNAHLQDLAAHGKRREP
jgi:putative copper resistance protein D